MRKVILAALAIASLAVPMTALADDVQDGADCRAANSPSVDPVGPAPVSNNEESDRGSACVAGGGHVILYIGGEAQAEEDGNPSAGGACGAVIVADQLVAGDTEDWNNDNGTPDDPSDDNHCD